MGYARKVLIEFQVDCKMKCKLKRIFFLLILFESQIGLDVRDKSIQKVSVMA